MPGLSDGTRDVLRKVFEVGFGVGVVFAAASLTKGRDAHSIVDDVVVGLLTIVATAFVLEPIEQKRVIRELKQRIVDMKATVAEIKYGIDKVNGAYADQLDRYTLALRFTNKSLDKDEMPNAWERMLWSMRGNFDATSFVKPDDYVRSYPDLGIAIQEAKVRVTKSRIRRIFIVENARELEAISAHIKKQMSAGVEVSYLIHSEIAKHVNTSKYDTLDFGLFDDSKSVFLWLLDDRAVAGGKIELETDQYAKYRNLFDTLCRLSRPCVFADPVNGTKDVKPGESKPEPIWQ